MSMACYSDPKPSYTLCYPQLLSMDTGMLTCGQPTPLGHGQTLSNLLLVHSAPGSHTLIMRACYALLLEPGPHVVAGLLRVSGSKIKSHLPAHGAHSAPSAHPAHPAHPAHLAHPAHPAHPAPLLRGVCVA